MSVTVIPKLTQIYYDTYANLPITGVKKPALAYATDRQILYNWDGSAWQPITKFSGSGLYADIPDAANLPNGSLYYATDTTKLWQVQGGVWVDISPVVPDVVMVRKTADETVNNSNALQNDDELTLTVGANEVWDIFLLLEITTGAAPDFAYAFTVPTGGVITGFVAGTIGALASALVAIAPLDLTTPHYIDGTINNNWACLWGRYIGGANAGNLQLQWAQKTADASDTTLHANSYIIAHKLN